MFGEKKMDELHLLVTIMCYDPKRKWTLKCERDVLLLPSESAWTLRTRNPFLYSSDPEGSDPSDRGFPLLPTRFIDLEALESPHRLSPSSENDFRSSSSSLETHTHAT